MHAPGCLRPTIKRDTSLIRSFSTITPGERLIAPPCCTVVRVCGFVRYLCSSPPVHPLSPNTVTTYTIVCEFSHDKRARPHPLCDMLTPSRIVNGRLNPHTRIIEKRTGRRWDGPTLQKGKSCSRQGQRHPSSLQPCSHFFPCFFGYAWSISSLNRPYRRAHA